MEPIKMIILDGGMGTQLQAAGLPMGQAPELWNITEPEKVTAVHRRYVEAGSKVLYTNTFGVNRLKTSRIGHSVRELVEGGVRCARTAAGEEKVRVALDIGPLGQILEPLGTLRFEEAYDIFREIVEAGRDAGADLIVLETMSDLYEVKAAVLAAKENSTLPVWVTMTFEASGRTFVGTTISAMGLTLSGLGVDAMGFNCSLGPKELLPMIRELRRWTDKPLILKPNAGLPDPATGEYRITPEEFVAELELAPGEGVQIMGGCCGTTPDFIRVLSAAMAGERTPSPLPERCSGVCSATQTAAFGPVRVIGERINPTGKKRFLPGINEPEMMTRVVKALQAVVDLPLQIDSSDPAAIEAGLRAVNGKAIVNSVNGKAETLRAILPICKKYGAAVVGLCMDENGIPQTWQERVAIAKRILDAALAAGIPKEDVLIDCLTLTVSAQQEQAAQTLKALRVVHEELGLHTVLGVSNSNISFGLPARENITVSFLTQALYAGLDLPIINPNQAEVMDAVASFRVLSGEDRDSEAYIRRFAGTESETKKTVSKPGKDMSLADCILRGLKAESAAVTRRELESRSEMDVINQLLIPALDRVGELYEKQEILCLGISMTSARISFGWSWKTTAIP